MSDSAPVEASTADSESRDAVMEDDQEIKEVVAANEEADPNSNPDLVSSFGAAGDDAVGASSSTNVPANAYDATIPDAEVRIPTKKDITLREFLGKMDDYAPIIPDAVTNYYLTLAGLPPPPQTPPHLARLLALATQKFVADIAADSYQYARIRSSHTTSNTAAAMASIPGAGAAAYMANAGAGAGGALGAGAASSKEGGAAGGASGPGGKQGMNLGVQRPGFGGVSQGGNQGRTVLTMEDLGMAVGEYGVNVKRGEFYR